MKILTGQQMQDLDQRAIRHYAIPSLLLMENAGRSVAEVMAESIPDLEEASVAVLAGKGNNGGDGLCVARHLNNMGVWVEVFVVGSAKELSEETRLQAEILNRSGIKLSHIKSKPDLARLDEALATADVVVDALLGIGVKGAVRGILESVIEAINTSGALVIAVDLPSGVDAEAGRVEGVAVQADFTITLEYPKLGLFLHPGSEYAGDVVVASIGYPEQLKEVFNSKITLTEDEEIRAWLPVRNAYSHKGGYGRVMILAGSKGLSGAALLAGHAALRSGTGLVYMGYPESLSGVIESQLWEAIKVPLPESNGALSKDSLMLIEKFIDENKIDVLAIGPGLSQQTGVKPLVQKLIARINLPVVIDADGLNALANPEGRKLLGQLKSPKVLTPHPGELARLTGRKISEIEADRVGIAREAAQKWGAVLVLKGAPTVTALPDGEIFINSTGNSGLATGGSGDVLTGMIAGLISQGMPVERAAPAGVYLHGLLADKLAPRLGERAMLPRDLLRVMPRVMSAFE